MPDDSPPPSHAASKGRPGGPQAMPQRLEVGGRDDGKRLDRVLRRRFSKLPQSLLQRFLRQGVITHNGRRAEARQRVASGDSIELRTDLSEFRTTDDDAREQRRRREKAWGFRSKFRVLHEDGELIAVDKPAGVVVHPAQGHHRGGTLLDLLSLHLPERFSEESDYRPAFVHRLDRGTSGVIVAAKTREAAKGLERALRERRAKKTYLALVRGHLKQREGTIELEIGRRGKPSGPTRYWAVGGSRAPLQRFPDPRTGKKPRPAEPPAGSFKKASTHFRVKRRLKGFTLVEIDLGSGRTHQIRVHFAAIGHPVCGDGDYGDKAVNRRLRERHGLERLFLHAAELVVPHPRDDRELHLRAPLPEELQRVLAGLERREK